MERPGDMSIEERVNSGQCELAHFFPDTPERDAYEAMLHSPMRGHIYWGIRQPPRLQHQSTRRDYAFLPAMKTPDYVVDSTIWLGDRYWEYHTPTDHVSSIRRVFILRNQALELDIDESLKWMSCSQGTGRYEEARAQLEEEVKEINNQVILQLMYERVQRNLPMLEVSSKNPINVPSKDSLATA